MRKTVIVSTVVAAIALVASAASAQGEPQPPRDEHLFFGQIWLGLGDCGGHLCGPEEGDTGPSFGTGAGVFIRPIPYFAAGLVGHFNWMAAEHDNPDRQAELGTYGLFNIAARGIIPVSIVDIWGGVESGFAWWGYSWEKEDHKEEDITLSGFDFAFSLGVDVNVADRIWIGGLLRFAIPFWGDQCKEKVDPDGSIKEECDPVSELDQEDQDEHPSMLWFTGITGRIDF